MGTIANDALEQLAVLIHRVEGGSLQNSGQSAHLETASRLMEPEAWSCLRQLQLWLATFPGEESAKICVRLAELASGYQDRGPLPPTLQQIYKAEPGSDAHKTPRMSRSFSGAAPNFEDDDDELESGEGFDASGWLERGRDEIKQETATDSVELYLFKTAALVLENMSALGALHLIEEPVVKFFFVSLEKAATLSAQRCAAVCCSVLSREHLHLLVACFFERQTKVPEKKFRWLLYQQATQMLAFGVASQEQAEVTVRFLEAMQKKMEKTDRGKLRGAMCTSLEKVFTSIMKADDVEARAAAARPRRRPYPLPPLPSTSRSELTSAARPPARRCTPSGTRSSRSSLGSPSSTRTRTPRSTTSSPSGRARRSTRSRAGRSC